VIAQINYSNGVYNYKKGIIKESFMKCAGVEDPFTMNVLIVGYMLDSTLDYECRGYFII